MLTLFIKTRESLTLAGGEGASPRGPYTFPGILARLRAMASSTALSCFRSSSRRDSVLAFPDLVPVETAVAVPASEALPGTLVTLLELLDWGDSWRFLQGVGGLRGEPVRGSERRPPSPPRRGPPKVDGARWALAAVETGRLPAGSARSSLAAVGGALGRGVEGTRRPGLSWNLMICPTAASSLQGEAHTDSGGAPRAGVGGGCADNRGCTHPDLRPERVVGCGKGLGGQFPGGSQSLLLLAGPMGKAGGAGAPESLVPCAPSF